jgi:putative transposase
VTHAAGIQDRDAAPIVLAGIIKRSDIARGFEVLPSGWVVARTFAWLRRSRPLAKHFEETSA